MARGAGNRQVRQRARWVGDRWEDGWFSVPACTQHGAHVHTICWSWISRAPTATRKPGKTGTPGEHPGGPRQATCQGLLHPRGAGQVRAKSRGQGGARAAPENWCTSRTQASSSSGCTGSSVSSRSCSHKSRAKYFSSKQQHTWGASKNPCTYAAHSRHVRNRWNHPATPAKGLEVPPLCHRRLLAKHALAHPPLQHMRFEAHMTGDTGNLHPTPPSQQRTWPTPCPCCPGPPPGPSAAPGSPP